MTIEDSEAAHRRGFSCGCMIELSVPLHIEWMGGLPATTYLEQVLSRGVRAVEVQLPPALSPALIAPWAALAQAATEHGCAVAIHAPLPPEHPGWPALLRWLQQLAAQSPLVLIVHGCTAPRRDSTLAAQTVAFARRLLADLPPTTTLAIEQGWNSALRSQPGAVLRRIQQRWRSQRQRPSGVGSGMGVSQPTAPRGASMAEAIFDPSLEPSWWQRRSRATHFSATGTREATLQIVEQIDRPNCVIAWDLAHDWLGSRLGEATTWPSIPPTSFLRRVGYVRLHDVSDDGCDHWPLVVGNVPYTSQLRALLRAGFDGPVCLAVRYPAVVQTYGDRWQTLDRSLAVARQTLRLH